jgi:hypothetical protein
MNCHHCGQAKITRPRNLCWTCYYDSTIREKHSPSTRNRIEPHCRELPLPPRPTRARPGSLAKLIVFRRRARLRVQLFHPEDA